MNFLTDLERQEKREYKRKWRAAHREDTKRHNDKWKAKKAQESELVTQLISAAFSESNRK